MKKFLVLAALAMMAAGPVEAQGFFKKMGQSIKKSWDNYQNEKSGSTSSRSSSSQSSSSNSTRQSKPNVKFGSVNTSENAGRWIPVMEYKNNNDIQRLNPNLFINENKEDLPQRVYCSALRYPKSTKLPSDFKEHNCLEYHYSDGYFDYGVVINYQKWGDEKVKEDNVFYTYNEYIHPNEQVIFRQKEDGDWIVWEFVEDLTYFLTSDEWTSFIEQAQVFVSNSQQKVMEQNIQKLNKKEQQKTEMYRKNKEVKTSNYEKILDIPNYPVKERRVINADVKDQEPHVEVLFENGDSLYIYKHNLTFEEEIYWSGRIHLLNGDLIEAYHKDMKMRITYTNGNKYYGDMKGTVKGIDGSYVYGMNTVEALEKALRIDKQTAKQNGFTPEGGEWTLADGTTKHEESREERIDRENKAAAKKEAEQKRKEKQALYTKYGQKYVDALVNNGEILVGCPIGLLKDKCRIELSSNSGNGQVYHLYSTVSNYSRSGIIGDKRTDWTHTIWVRNGRVTGVTDHRR